MSISDTVNNALKVYLSDEYSMERDSAILRRLDRMTRENEQFNQKLAIQSEALAGFKATAVALGWGALRTLVSH